MPRTLLALAVVGALGAAFLLGRSGAWREEPAPGDSGEPAPVGPSDRALADAVRTLADRVANLERERLRDERDREPGPPRAVQGDEDPPGDPDLDEEGQDHAVGQRQTGLLEGAMRSEPRDRAWATEAEHAIQQAFEDGALAGSTIEQVTCASRLCRLETRHESRPAADRMMRELPLRTPFLPSAHIERISDDRSVVFFGRTQEDIRRVADPEE